MGLNLAQAGLEVSILPYSSKNWVYRPAPPWLALVSTFVSMVLESTCVINTQPKLKTRTKPSNDVVKLEARAYPGNGGSEDQDFKVVLSYSEFEVSLGYSIY